ncbi:MAG: thermonuclease family protein [Desulfobacteraceae bacterium]|nr:thermonuclease family protein [Desulfobacteraceae bacterium]
MRITSIFYTILLSLLLPALALAWSGQVVGISDGDTITVLKDNKTQVKIRLYGVDTPEKKQAFGKKAKQFTAELAFRQRAEIKTVNKDHYGRTVAWLIINGKNLNAELIKAGLAWHYTQYSNDKNLADLEKKARQNKTGLWSDPDAVAPWEFRKAKRSRASGSKAENRHNSPAGAYHGNSKSHVFHASTCRYFNCKNCTVVFHSKKNALATGFKPCQLCTP